MRSHTWALVLAAALPSGYVLAGDSVQTSELSLDMTGPPMGGAAPASPTPAYLTGARIMATGDGALVIDADTGMLFKTDRAGRRIAALAIARDAGLMTLDRAAGLAYVADRKNDRIAVVKIDTMALASSIATPVEPFGVALTPDRKLLLVSAIADRTLVAYDTAGGAERWRLLLGAEPRGIAVSPDGTRAIVAYVTTGTVDEINLAGARSVRHIALSTATTAATQRCRLCEPERDGFARVAFAVTFLGDHQAVVPFQREVPVQASDGGERVSSYGGGSESPITAELAFLGFGDGAAAEVTAEISQHQVRALAWDQAHDALYLAGLADDSVVRIQNASQAAIAGGTQAAVGKGRDRCGPDGLAVDPAGGVLVWCSFTRSVERLDFGELHQTPQLATGPALAASAMTARQHQGMVLFHSADERISRDGSLACASCHPDNRADGLSWRIDKGELQTPLLAGRLVGTHPFKWDGTDATLRDSLRSTMKRLGGEGLSRRETDALAAYLESLPTVRTPSQDPERVARGKRLFDAEGCAGCHAGPAYTDRVRHKLSGTLKEADTPSLLGVAASAPYFHDGSAATLEVVLRDRGAVHGMADTAALNDQQVADLTAFLDTL